MDFKSFLVRNRPGSTWQARVYVPKHLQHLFHGRAQLKKTTGHRDKRQAGRAAAIFWAQCQALFDDLDQQMKKKKSRKSDTFDLGLVTTVDVLGNSQTFDWGGDKNPKLAKMELDAAKDFQKAAVEVLERHKDNPELIKALKSANTATAVTTDPNTPETVMTWEELFDKYVAKERERVSDPTHKITQTSFDEYEPHRKLWEGYFANREVHTIKRAEIKEVESWLKNLPTSLKQRKLSILDGIAMAKSNHHKLDTLSAGSYNHYQRQIAGLLKYAYELGAHKVDLSPCIKQMNAKRGQKTFRVPFTPEDMRAMFCGSGYIENFGRKNKGTTHAAKFWMPLIAVFSGARMDELCQLKISDVRYSDAASCHYLHLIGSDETAPDGEQKRIKNKTSIRPIPVHTTLSEIGFLRYVESLAGKDRESSLFGLERAPDGKWGSPLSKWFTRKPNSSAKGFIERCGIVSSGPRPNGKKWSKTFHCFRHTVVTNLRDKSKLLPDGTRLTAEDIALVVGHLEEESSRLETHNYGEAVENMEFRRDIISLISYPGVDFSSIKWPSHST
jgi:integrase